jgi:hypothetical protein
VAKLLEQEFEVVRQLPEDRQDELAQGLIQAAKIKGYTFLCGLMFFRVFVITD